MKISNIGQGRSKLHGRLRARITGGMLCFTLVTAGYSAVCSPLAFAAATESQSDPAQTDAEQVIDAAAAVNTVTGEGDAQLVVASDGTITDETLSPLSADGSSVEVPADPADGLAVTTPDGDAVNIGLPGANKADDAVVVDGVIVYTDAAPATSVAVKIREQGSVQALVVMENETAPESFPFRLTFRMEAVWKQRPTGRSQPLVLTASRSVSSRRLGLPTLTGRRCRRISRSTEAR